MFKLCGDRRFVMRALFRADFFMYVLIALGALLCVAEGILSAVSGDVRTSVMAFAAFLVVPAAISLLLRFSEYSRAAKCLISVATVTQVVRVVKSVRAVDESGVEIVCVAPRHNIRHIHVGEEVLICKRQGLLHRTDFPMAIPRK